MKLKALNSTLISVFSLIIALSALGYNTWRNEVTEQNRNIRSSGFEILKESARLQLLVDRGYYADEPLADPIEGWTRINFILSLSHIMPDKVQLNSQNLKSAWSENWQTLRTDGAANQAITNANKQLEVSIIEALRALN